MTHVCNITERVKRAQARVFRLAKRDLGLTLEDISLESGIGVSTLRTYIGTKGEASVMNVATLNKLRSALPDYLLSHILEPSGGVIGDAEDCDFDAYAGDCIRFVARHAEATHPDSPAGRDISDCEARDLKAIKGGKCA